MPPFRCWGYDDEGKATRKGCHRGDDCGFIHPTNPRWATAKRSGADRPPKRDSQSQKRTSGSFGDSSRSNDPWDKTSWHLTSSNATPVGPRALSALSTPIDQGSRAQDSCSSESGPQGQPGGAAGPSTEGGQSTAQASGWGSGWDSGWGAAGQTSDNQDVWAAQSAGGWGAWGDNAQNTNPGNEQSGWNTGFSSDKGKGKEKEAPLAVEDVQMKDVPPSRSKDAMPPPAFIPQPAKPSRQSDSFTAPLDPPKSTPSATERKVQRPLPGRSRIPSESNTLKEEASKLLNQSPLTKSDGVNNYRGPKGRITLYTAIIKQMQLVISSQLELRRAKAEKEHFKNAVKPYTHPPVQAQSMFNALLAKYSAKDKESEKRAERQLAALVDLPDFSAAAGKIPSQPLVKETVTAYTEELRDWFTDLQLDKRILMDKPEEPVGHTQDAPRSPASSDSLMDTRPAKELLERGSWSWQEIQDATSLLETRLNNTVERVNTILSTGSSWDAMFDEVPHKLMTLLPDPETVIQEVNIIPPVQLDVDSLSTTTDEVGNQLQTQSERIAILLGRVQALEEENLQVKAEQEKLDGIYAEAQERFTQFEEWKRADIAKIKELTEEIQNLHKLQVQRRAALSQTPSAAMSLPPVALEELLTDIRPMVLQQMQQEIMPVLEKLRERCIESHEELKAHVASILATPVAMTDEICHRVLQMGITEAQTFT